MFKKRKKDTRSYRGFKYWPTKKLIEVIDEPYNRGVDGHDYQPYIEEIKDVYYERLNNNDIEKQIEERYGK
jgi:hypothetical protein